MAKKAETLRELAQVRADNRRLLNLVAGNQGTALGRKDFTAGGEPEGDPCIIVYMPHKIHFALLGENLRVPSKLTSRDGALEAPTDVVVTTRPDQPKGDPTLSPENRELADTLQWRNGKLNRLVPGAQIGGADLTHQGLESYVGTLGYAVRTVDGDLPGILTNQHVGGTASRSMYIPGVQQQALRIGVTRTVREHYPDDQWIEGVDERFAYVRSDAALVAVEPELAGALANDVPELGEIRGVHQVDLDSMDIIGRRVKKVGRTTGLTEGIIVAYGYGIQNANEIIDRVLDAEPANVYTDFLIAAAPGFAEFSAPGDSGSAILVETQAGAEGLGLLWGGWPTDIGRNRGLEDLTYGIDLARLMTTMGLKLL